MGNLSCPSPTGHDLGGWVFWFLTLIAPFIELDIIVIRCVILRLDLLKRQLPAAL